MVAFVWNRARSQQTMVLLSTPQAKFRRNVHHEETVCTTHRQYLWHCTLHPAFRCRQNRKTAQSPTLPSENSLVNINLVAHHPGTSGSLLRPSQSQNAHRFPRPVLGPLIFACGKPCDDLFVWPPPPSRMFVSRLKRTIFFEQRLGKPFPRAYTRAKLRTPLIRLWRTGSVQTKFRRGPMWTKAQTLHETRGLGNRYLEL